MNENNNKIQHVDLYQPLVNVQPGPFPIALRVGSLPGNDMTVGGVMQGTRRVETYVLLSVLPTELQERVRIACQALIAGR